VAKCDTCGLKGKLKQSLPLLGEIKHFCDLSCLLHFCCDTVALQGDVITGGFNPHKLQIYITQGSHGHGKPGEVVIF